MDRERIALQLYTIREQIAIDFYGTLRSIAEAGYAAVEFAGFLDARVDELRRWLDETGLLPVSSHVALEALEQETDRVLQWHADLKIHDLVVPWIAPALRTDVADWKKVAQRLNQVGARLAASGFTLAYHHHDFELVPLGNSAGLDILMDHCDPACVSLQVDTYWAAFGGRDPAALVSQYANRLASLHLKDMDATRERAMTEVGAGILDFPAILSAADRSTARWLIVEHDAPRMPPLESVRISLHNLRQILARKPRSRDQ
jgi:sugar phosphate isomerase/epimerase